MDLLGRRHEPLRSDDFQEDHQDQEEEEDREEDFCRFSLITFDLVDGSL